MEEDIRPELFAVGMKADCAQEALDCLAELLYRQRLVRESFAEAVKARERRYSTGLAFPEMGIAIPHADAEHVIRPGLAVGILKEPVEFRHMGMPEVSVEARLIFMLAIRDEEEQPEYLANLLDVFQTEGNLTRLASCRSAEEAAGCLKRLLQTTGQCDKGGGEE